MQEAYREDLAFIHNDGFGWLARAAAPVLLHELRRGGFSNGLVVDLGCGGGILSELIAARGFDVLGIDLSRSMIEMARSRVPQGKFRVGSILNAELPQCVGVAAVGEVINYLFDESNSKSAQSRLFRRILDALVPGGTLLLDAAGPGRVPNRCLRQHFEGDGWAVLVQAEEEARQKLLTRRIISFRKVGELYRRDEEIHRLRLLPRAELAGRLRKIGFRVRTIREYGTLQLPPGLSAFIARKVP